MKRFADTFRVGRAAAAALLVCGIAVGAAGENARAAAPTPSSSLVKLRCSSTLAPWQRSVSVVAVMGSEAGVHSLQMRFSLLEKLPGEAVQSVTDGDLGQWLSPADATLGQRAGDVWKLDKVVVAVDAPAHYRFRVQYRWLSATGHVVAQAAHTTGACAEQELRPDLVVRRVTVHPISGDHSSERYVATIANDGLTKTGPFSVLFTAGATEGSQTAVVPSLHPGARTRVSFTGPICDPGAPPTVVADPADAVDDFDRANNTVTVSCPA